MSTHAQTPTIISNRSEFDRWQLQLRRIGVLRTRYVLALSALSEDENQAYSNLINKYSKACGCNTGSALMAWSVIGAAVSYFATGGTIGKLSLNEVLWLVAVMLAGALIGKLFGLMRARWKLIKLAGEIAGRLREDVSSLKSKYYGTCMP